MHAVVLEISIRRRNMVQGYAPVDFEAAPAHDVPDDAQAEAAQRVGVWTGGVRVRAAAKVGERRRLHNIRSSGGAPDCIAGFERGQLRIVPYQGVLPVSAHA